MAVNWDKVSVGLDTIVAAMALSNRGGAQASQVVGNAVEKGRGFFASLLSLVIRVWEESGGSMKDESEMLESLFSGPKQTSQPLNVAERRKIALVLKEMTLAERNVFRIAIFLMDPEVLPIETDNKGGDGKVASTTRKTEKTGVDPRINVLRGIAEMVKDDHSNVAEVAEMLRTAGALGKDNKALEVFLQLKSRTAQFICESFEVEKLSDITLAHAKAKAIELLERFPTPDPSLPQEHDRAGVLARFGRRITPGSYPIDNVSPYGRRMARKERRIFVLGGTSLAALVLLAAFAKSIGGSGTNSPDIANAYVPQPTSAKGAASSPASSASTPAK